MQGMEAIRNPGAYGCNMEVYAKYISATINNVNNGQYADGSYANETAAQANVQFQ